MKMETERRYKNGQLWFRNGNEKDIAATSATVRFANGDIKKTHSDTDWSYFYASANTTHTTYGNGVEIFEFLTTGMELLCLFC